MKYRIGDSIELENEEEGIVEDYNEDNYIVRSKYGKEVEVPMEECAENTECELSNAQVLILALKIASLNLKTLHRNLKGGNWFRIHELLGDYYDAIDSHEDTIIENLMSIGIKDVAVGVYDNCPIFEAKEYSEEEAMNLTFKMFESILSLSQVVRNELNIPTTVAPAFDELENYLQIETEYKIKNYLNKKD